MRKVFAIVAALALAAATGASAQTASGPTPGTLQLARRIFADIGGEKAMQSIVESLRASLFAQQLKTLPPERQAKAEDLQAAALDEMSVLIPKLIEFQVQFYAANYTEAELTQLANFYESPTGRDLVFKQPLLASQLGTFMAAQMPLLRTGMVERYCARTSCTPELKTALLNPPGAQTAVR